MGNFLDAISRRTDESLLTLFQLRPDLANPSPTHVASLAARVSNTTSIARALAGCNARTLQVLEAVLLLKSLNQVPTAGAVVFAITGSHFDDGTSDDQDVAAVIDELVRLTDYALAWREDDHKVRFDSEFFPSPGVETSLERFPAGFGPLSSNDVQTQPLPPDAPELASSVVDALLWGPPVAVVPTNLLSVRPASSEPATNEALRWLLRNGYLELLDESHVYLPRQTAFALRSSRTHKGLSYPPLAHSAPVLNSTSISAEAALHAQESVRLVSELIDLWEHAPAPALRNGGLPVRELKRVAQALDVSAQDATLVLEIAFAAQLVRSADDGAKDFAPTQRVDSWLEATLPQRWSHLVQGTVASSRMAWRVGQLDERASTINPLHPQIHAPWVTRLRASIIAVLKQYPELPLTPDLVTSQLSWFAPRSGVSSDAVEGILAEFEFLGLTGSGALLPGVDSLDLPQALELALPDPVNDLFIQSDLTGMVPGRPSAQLESLLEVSAVVESRGNALTVRFTPQSISRAFDSGLGATELIESLQAVSVTPIPQPLTYLISDVARTHGSIRVGVASTYIKFPDDISAASVMSLGSRGLVEFFEIAPRVLGSSSPLSSVLSVLREAGLAPAVEGPDGQIVTADRQTPRVRVATRPTRISLEQHTGVATALGGDRVIAQMESVRTGTADLPAPPKHLVELVHQVRAASAGLSEQPAQGASSVLSSAGSRNESRVAGVVPSRPLSSNHAEISTPADEETSVVVVNLREAIAQNALVSLALADGSGTLHHRTVRPLTLEQGRLRAVDPARESELTVAIHRIATVTPA